MVVVVGCGTSAGSMGAVHSTATASIASMRRNDALWTQFAIGRLFGGGGRGEFLDHGAAGSCRRDAGADDAARSSQRIPRERRIPDGGVANGVVGPRFAAVGKPRVVVLMIVEMRD